METDSFHEYRQLSLLPKWGEELITLHLHSKAALLGLTIALLVSFKDDSVGPPPSWCVAGQVTGVSWTLLSRWLPALLLLLLLLLLLFLILLLLVRVHDHAQGNKIIFKF